MAAMAGRLDDVDRALLAVLEEDGRVSVNELARRAGVSRATAYARFDRLVRDGVIDRFTIDVAPATLGLDVTALVLLNVDQGAWPTVREKLANLPGTEYLALTSGGFDFALLVRAPDIAALRDVVLHRLQRMPEVRSSQTVFVLDEDRRPPGQAHFTPGPRDGGGATPTPTPRPRRALSESTPKARARRSS